MEEAKTKQSTVKRKIIISIISILLCMLLIGVSVYAATSQGFTVSNTITIGSSGEARIGIKASYSFGAADDERLLFDNSTEAVSLVKALPYSLIAEKATNEDEKTGVGPNIVFSYNEKYTYVAYKIELTNTEASDVSYVIEFKNQDDTSAYNFNSQIAVYSGSSEQATLQNDLAICTGTISKSESKTIYIVIAMEKELIDATPATLENFNLKITANSTEI